MKKPGTVIVAAFACMMLLCGCSSMLNREFVVTSRHAETVQNEPYTKSRRVTEIEQVKALLSEAIAEGSGSLSFQLVYQEDPTTVLNELITQYRETDPLCAYAVQMISSNMTKILNYYDVHIDIKYQHSRSDIAAIVTLDSPQRFRSELFAMLKDFAESRTFLIHNYNEKDYDFAATYEELHETEPETAYSTAQLYETVVPKAGMARIVEVSIHYEESPETLRECAKKAASQAEMIASNVLETADTGSDGTVALMLHDSLCRFAVYDETTAVNEAMQTRTDYTAPYTAYGALIRFHAVSTGYAMAYKQLCDCTGVECRVIHGRLGSENHSWNLVKLEDGEWYHVDVSLDDDEYRTGYRFFGVDDETMRKTHQWDESMYPSCSGTEARTLLNVEEELMQHSRYKDSVFNYPGIIPNPLANVDVEDVSLP